MSQLVRMKNRMKAVKTIEKTTHAMRLVSMSTHVRLRDQEPYIQGYQQSVASLFNSLATTIQTWQHPAFNPTKKQPELIIVIGSQKGLCGSFNTALFNFFKKEFPVINNQLYQIISVGKKVSDYLRTQQIIPIESFDTFSSQTLPSIAQNICSSILSKKKPYGSVTIINNYQKTFFTQRQKRSLLIPHSQPEEKNKIPLLHDYTWFEDPHVLLDRLAHTYMRTTIEYHLFESLLSEQAARFISMDSSTRNAKQTVETMQKQYNKLRQAKITKELTELSTSFQLNSGT